MNCEHLFVLKAKREGGGGRLLGTTDFRAGGGREIG